MYLLFQCCKIYENELLKYSPLIGKVFLFYFLKNQGCHFFFFVWMTFFRFKKKMVKSLLNMCLDILQKPCAFEADLNLYWLNCGMGCIPFKFYNQLVADEFFHCTCKKRIFKITKPSKPDYSYSM